MMLSRNAIGDVTELLHGADFYRPVHETIFDAIVALHGRGEPADAVTVTGELTKAGEIARIGGPAYLHELIQMVPTASNAGYYAEIVAKAAMARRVKAAAVKIAEAADGSLDDDDLIDMARTEIDKAARVVKSDVGSFGETIDYAIDCLSERVTYTPTPWPALNQHIGGFRPGALYVVGARPGVGKSVIALQSALCLTGSGAVAFSSLEMSEQELQYRAMSYQLKIDLSRIMERQLSPADWQKIAGQRAAWNNTPLFIDDRSGVTLAQVKQFARSVHRRKALGAVVVDYLQLMTAARGDKRPRHEIVADYSRQLKILAREMNVPVIALSQLNRASESRNDKMPMLSDLRESGAVEQDADVVLLLHRELADPKAKHELKMLVAKNRHGGQGVVSLDFIGHHSEARSRV
jgi:replicative DNA helicase